MDGNIQDRAAMWWHRHTEDRALMAKLRRTRAPVEALAVDGFIGLHRTLGAKPENAVRHAHLARVLAHVRENSSVPLPRALAGGGGDRAPLSEARLRRLLQIERKDADELARALVRLVRMLKGRANVRDLTTAMLFWGDGVKTEWAYAYFGAADAVPPASPETEDAQ
jgi:CRISPR type I-E-associated protein CasB/Cse2